MGNAPDDGAVTTSARRWHKMTAYNVEPLNAEDRADLAVLEAAAERGYQLMTWCRSCGRALSARKSLLAHQGPTCRSKAVIR